MNRPWTILALFLSSSMVLAQGQPDVPSDTHGTAPKRSRIIVCGPIIQSPRRVPDAVTLIETRRPQPTSLLRLRRDFRSHMDRSTLPAP